MSHLFAGRRWVLETRLTQEECVTRLKAKLRGMWETEWDADRPLYGTVTSSGFAVQITVWQTSGGVHQTINPLFVRGRFTRSAAGTTIQATYGVLTSYRLFIIGLVSFFLFMGWLVLRPFPPGSALFFGTPLLVIALLLYWWARRLIRLGETDRELILNALAEFLEARLSEAP
jgi:hypothetical protein